MVSVHESLDLQIIQKKTFAAMRFCLFLIVISIFVGCNADPRMRRESALLRAEIIDLEDKYYLMKSQYDSVLTDLKICRGEPIDEMAYGQYEGDIIYEDEQIISGPIISGPVISGPNIFGSGIQTGTTTYSNEVVTAPGTSSEEYLTAPTPAQPRTTSQPARSETDPVVSQPAETGEVETRIEKSQSDVRTGIDSNNSQPNSGEVFEDDPVFDGPVDLQIDIPEDSSNTDELSPPPGQDQSFLYDGPAIEAGEPENNVSESPITEITIDPVASRGHDVDAKPGDDGLELLLRPKTGTGVATAQPGALTVSVIDPKQLGRHQRIGLWKFSPEDTQLFVVNDGQQGIKLRLPWENYAPKNRRLMVFVRYITRDGRKLETAREFRITPPTGRYSAEDPLIADWSMGGSPITTDAVVGGSSTGTFRRASSSRSMIDRPMDPIDASTPLQIEADNSANWSSQNGGQRLNGSQGGSVTIPQWRPTR